MKMDIFSQRWLTETERIICLAQHEFAFLTEQQLNYTLHVRRCNIRQIMQHVIKTNARLIDGIERALHRVKVMDKQQEFKPTGFGKYVLRSTCLRKCIPVRKPGQHDPLGGRNAAADIADIVSQQYKLKEIIALCMKADINEKVIPFKLFGLIRLSIAETLNYLFLSQKYHFRMARNILMIQMI